MAAFAKDGEGDKHREYVDCAYRYQAQAAPPLPAGNEARNAAGTGEAVAESFQKKLKDCGITAAPAQQTAADNSQENLETGTAEGSGTVEAFPGCSCPRRNRDAGKSAERGPIAGGNGRDAANLCRQAADRKPARRRLSGRRGNAESIARMQTAETGAIPGKTQDQILEPSRLYRRRGSRRRSGNRLAGAGGGGLLGPGAGSGRPAGRSLRQCRRHAGRRRERRDGRRRAACDWGECGEKRRGNGRLR